MSRELMIVLIVTLLVLLASISCICNALEVKWKKCEKGGDK